MKNIEIIETSRHNHQTFADCYGTPGLVLTIHAHDTQERMPSGSFQKQITRRKPGFRVCCGCRFHCSETMSSVSQGVRVYAHQIPKPMI